MKRSCIITILSIITTLVLGISPVKSDPQEQPNVIFIVLDAARADHLSCYGYDKETTPCIDAIAKKGAVFLNHFSNATFTQLSLPSIFSSRYFSKPIFEQFYPQWNLLCLDSRFIFSRYDKEQTFLPKILSENGYKTAFFHNHPWLIKKSPIVKMFGETYTFPVALNFPVGKQLFGSMGSWINAHRNESFFIYCHIMSPHEPYPHKKEDLEFVNQADRPALAMVREKYDKSANNSSRGWIKKDLELFHALYDGNLKHTDSWVGYLYDHLCSLGLDKNTLFIITADHGEGLGQHNNLGHGGPPFDEQIHVPLIMTYPGKISPGTRTSGLTESVDLMPTILDMTGMRLPKDKSLDGINLYPLIHGSGHAKKCVFTFDSIRTDKHKLLLYENLLFDLKKDPNELNSLATSHPVTARLFRSKYEACMNKYKKRYESAKKDEPPFFPFYINSGFYKASPAAAVSKVYIKTGAVDRIKAAANNKPWANNQHHVHSGFFRFPDNAPPQPITLSIQVPSGKYQISMLLESSQPIPVNPDMLKFSYRFDKKHAFVSPQAISPTLETGPFYRSYLGLGHITVKNKSFMVEVDCAPPNNSYYCIRHIKFEPMVSGKKEAVSDLSKDELDASREGLKALGYLQ